MRYDGPDKSQSASRAGGGSAHLVRRMRHHAHNIILLAGCLALTACSPSQPTRGKRYDKPLTYAQAAKEQDITFPLPASAHNIYYGIYGEWQAYTLIVRFDAPVQDCIKHIDTVLAWDD